jgi:hypothetical protein
MKIIFTTFFLLGIFTLKAEYSMKAEWPCFNVENEILDSQPDIYNFTATLQSNNNVNLDWSINKTANVQKIIIEKSTDKVNFKVVGNLTPKTLAEQEAHYALIDFNFETKGSIFYRIKLVDTKGEFKYSDVTVVQLSATNL